MFHVSEPRISTKRCHPIQRLYSADCPGTGLPFAFSAIVADPIIRCLSFSKAIVYSTLLPRGQDETRAPMHFPF